jgi:hypothetical protein
MRGGVVEEPSPAVVLELELELELELVAIIGYGPPTRGASVWRVSRKDGTNPFPAGTFIPYGVWNIK